MPTRRKPAAPKTASTAPSPSTASPSTAPSTAPKMTTKVSPAPKVSLADRFKVAMTMPTKNLEEQREKLNEYQSIFMEAQPDVDFSGDNYELGTVEGTAVYATQEDNYSFRENIVPEKYPQSLRYEGSDDIYDSDGNYKKREARKEEGKNVVGILKNSYAALKTARILKESPALQQKEMARHLLFDLSEEEIAEINSNDITDNTQAIMDKISTGLVKFFFHQAIQGTVCSDSIEDLIGTEKTESFIGKTGPIKDIRAVEVSMFFIYQHIRYAEMFDIDDPVIELLQDLLNEAIKTKINVKGQSDYLTFLAKGSTLRQYEMELEEMLGVSGKPTSSGKKGRPGRKPKFESVEAAIPTMSEEEQHRLLAKLQAKLKKI